MDGSIIEGVTFLGVSHDEQGEKLSPFLLVDFGGSCAEFHTRIAAHGAVTLDIYKGDNRGHHYSVTVGDFVVNKKEAFQFSFNVTQEEHEEFQRALIETGGSWYLVTMSCGEREHRLIDRHGTILVRGCDDGEEITVFQAHVAV